MAPPPRSRIPSAVQTALFLRSPLDLMSRLHRAQGDVSRADFVGTPPLAYLADPEHVKELFSHDGEEGHAGEARRPYFEAMVGQSSLLVLDGERWFEQRKLIGPPLHGKRIAGFREQIDEIAAEQVARWPVGEPFALRPRMQAITLEVILRVVFGLAEGERRERLRELIPRLIDEGQWLVWMPPRIRDPLIRHFEGRPRLRRLLPLVRALDVREEVDRLLYAEIADRRGDPDLSGRGDVLSLLLDSRDERGEPMSDAELRDELITLLEAGHETTATALSWAFERLCRSPAAYAALRSELDRDGDGEYLKAVVKETLRSRPVVIDVIRHLRGPVELGGYEIPAGWFAAPAITLIHNLPRYHPDPELFRPERFLAEDPPYAAWLPFGGGQRRCVGSNLAQLEMATVISRVLERFDVEPAAPEAERARIQHVTLVPSKGARVVLRRRAGAATAPAAVAAGVGADVPPYPDG